MTRIVFALLMIMTASMAELTQVWATPEFAEKNIKIIDIRTPTEWKETGIIKGSYTIMFFDEQGRFYVPDFLKKIDKIVKKDEQFALICRVGSRTGMVSEFLSEKLGYKVINLKGGIMKMIHEGYKTVPYKE
ncbi:MAG TPA: rhodanese-like domain-containing protein [Sulfurovum sp.]|nr:rhodanese-like domain-containing protein [Sulfurovum sp.]